MSSVYHEKISDDDCFIVDMCCICREPFDARQLYSVCSAHIFHTACRACVKMLVEYEQQACPLCRADVVLEYDFLVREQSPIHYEYITIEDDSDVSPSASPSIYTPSPAVSPSPAASPSLDYTALLAYNRASPPTFVSYGRAPSRACASTPFRFSSPPPFFGPE